MPESTAHWRKTCRLTIGLLLVWLFVTFGLGCFAVELNAFVFAGFPLGFYMGAQGVLVIYVVIVWYYNRRMRQLDAEHHVEDE